MSTTAPGSITNTGVNAQEAAAKKRQSKPRLMSLDALRGFDMFWILGGEALFGALLMLTGWAGWQWGDTQMHHSEWNGFRFYDLIFPLFIFLSGVALGLSPKRLDKLPMQERMPVYRHGIKRLFLLLLLGILYNHGWGTGAPADPDKVRYASVLGRIAFAWFFAALLVWHTSLRTQVLVALGILVVYGAVQLWLPFPGGQAGVLSPTESINAYVDSLLLPGVSYQGRTPDPEGVLSTLPAVVNALAGVFVGHFIVKSHPKGEWAKVGLLSVAGGVCLALGWLLDGVIPVNKELWTSSFVLVTSGWSMLLLALFYALVDVLKWQKLAFIFVVIGTNAIIIYLASSIVDWKYIAQSVFGGVIAALPENAQPFGAVIGLLTVQWLVLYWMYRRNIFVRI
ncbi:transmembrane glucosamine N-acetyltransferase NagX [Shewanella mangrovisoli]|uniref:Transmembrane glucosamine N-acetyltransferase NagX n=1 Tax=Shewanella mangrovisoli TaxID=2864211 RepID=A0ABV4VD70_9GAMM